MPTLPKYLSCSEYFFFPFSSHVTLFNLFDDRNCDVVVKVMTPAVVEKVLCEFPATNSSQCGFYDY